MNFLNLVRRLFILVLLVAAALMSSSCEGGNVGVGVGVGYPARWGGGSMSGPPIFVGGPAY